MSIPGPAKISIAVLSPGAVGGFLLALFSQHGFEVTCIAREEAAAEIKKNGFRLESRAFGDFVVNPRVVTRLDIKPDLLFVTTKFAGLPAAMECVDPALTGQTVIIPLLNGLEHIQLLRSRFGPRVITASIGEAELVRISARHVRHTTQGAIIKMASDGDISVSRLKEISSILIGIGLQAEILRSEAEVSWEKLVRLNAISTVTSASGQPIGKVRKDNYWRGQLIKCIEEGAQVARAEGASIDPKTVLEKIDQMPGDLLTSMYRDVIAGRAGEVDAIPGAIVRTGLKRGIRCQIIQDLIIMINERIQNNKTRMAEDGL